MRRIQNKFLKGAVIKLLSIICLFAILPSNIALAEEMELSAASVILMEASTGAILYAKVENAVLPPASVTKVMTMLLICEAIADGKITLQEEGTTSEYAASKNGVDLIAVIMAAPSSKERNADAVKLLNYGFSKTQIYVDEEEQEFDAVPIEKGAVVGRLTYSLEGEKIGEVELLATERMEPLEYRHSLMKVVELYLL